MRHSLHIWILLLIGGILISACDNEVKPEGLLSHEEMIPILMDMHIADAVAMKSDAPIRDRTSYKDDLYESILYSHDIDNENFYESYQYYLLHPEEMNEIYDQVIERLNEAVPSQQKKMRDRDLRKK